MKNRIGKRVLMFALIIVLVVSMLPMFPATTVEAANIISEAEMTLRVKELAVRLGLNEDLSNSKGVYFTKSGGTCCGSNGCTKENCQASYVLSSSSAFVQNFDFSSVSASKLPWHYDDLADGDCPDDALKKGASCAGFANFALWYLGKTDNSTDLNAFSGVKKLAQGEPNNGIAFNEENLRKYDIRIGDVIRCGGHSAIFLGYTSNGIKVLDCNWYKGDNTVRVSIHTNMTYDSRFGGQNMGITRLANYNPYASAPVISNINFRDPDQNGFTVTCTVTDDEGVGAVYFPIWTYANGQDDLPAVWPTGTYEGNNTYSYRVNVSDHNYEYGTYVIHIYARDINGVQGGPAMASFENSSMNPNPDSGGGGGSETPPVVTNELTTAEVTARVKDLAVRMGLDANLNYSNGSYFTADGQTCCGSSSCSNCKLDNVISSNAFHNAFGFTISDAGILSRHYACEEMRVKGAGSCGFANFALWYIGKDSNTSNLYDESNIIAITRGTNFTEANLTSLNLKIGDVIYCNKSDGSAGRSAVFLGYEAGGIKVMDANWGTDGTKMRVAIHHWAYNNADFANGTMAVTRLAKHKPGVDTTAPTISNVVISNADANGYTVTVTASDDIGVARISFPTRRVAQTDNDWIWRDGTQNADGSWSYRVNISEYGGVGGEYWTDVYAYDDAGNTSAAHRVLQYVDTTAPVISNVQITNVTGSGYTVECTVTDDVGVAKVQFPTWTSYNGQDDLVDDWQNSSAVSGTAYGNVYKFRVEDIAHDYERGAYNTHIYAFDAAGNYSMVEWIHELRNDGIVVAEKTYNGHTYKVIDDKMTWEEAKVACEDMGGHLVTITSAEEQEVIESLMEENYLVGYFIGGYMENNSLHWITGEKVSYTNWYPGEPSVTDGETICELYTSYLVGHIGSTSDAYRWNNINNDAEGRGYICEIEPVSVSSITLSDTNIELEVNKTKTLTATLMPQDGLFPAVVWSSANTNVATVSNGVVTAVGSGTTTITAECGGKKATCTVKVVKPYGSIKFDETSKELFIKESTKLNVSYLPADAVGSKDLIWSSSNNKVAVVDDNGVITALSAGNATITAKLANNQSILTTCNVQVKSYVVTFNTNGGSTVASVECGKGEILSVETPSRDGYAFTGWYTDSACTELWDIETAIVEKTMTLYAGWMEYHEGLWIIEIPDQQYTGKAIKPEVEVYNYDEKLVLGKDYTVSYKYNTNACDKTAEKAPTVTVTGKGNYSGKETVTFTILSQSLEDESIVIDDIYCASNGKEQKKVPTVVWNGKKLKKDKDYTISYPDTMPGAYTNAGTYTVLVTGKGNYSGSREISLHITGLNLISKVKTSKIANQIYTGSAIEPDFTVKYGQIILTEGVDYTLQYSNNTSVGTATVLITGKGSYSGEKKITFKIVGTPINKAKVYNLPKSVEYDGSAQNDLAYELQIVQGGITKTLVEGEDYTVSYQNNTKVGTASIIFTGINGYTGSLKKTFKITPYDVNIDNCNAITVSDDFIVAYMKGNTVIEPTVTYFGETLVKDKDYKLTFKYNKKVSSNAVVTQQPIVIITGKGNFKGSISYNFEIQKQDISNLTLTVADKVYQNKAGKYVSSPVITDINGKKLSAGTDYDKKATYTYTYDTKLVDGTLRQAGSVVGEKDIVPAGTTITVSVKGLGNYSGNISGTYRIVQADISKAKAAVVNQVYTGDAIEPGKDEITLKISGFKLAEADYEIVSYSNNVNKGTATIIVKGVGNYGGTKKITFKIQKKLFNWWWR